MPDIFSWPTPNRKKLSLLLEQTGPRSALFRVTTGDGRCSGGVSSRPPLNNRARRDAVHARLRVRPLP
jgi:hypothetical protein